MLPRPVEDFLGGLDHAPHVAAASGQTTTIEVLEDLDADVSARSGAITKLGRRERLGRARFGKLLSDVPELHQR